MKNHKYKHFAAAAMTLLLFAGMVHAQQAQTVSAPRTLSYQGVLSSNGAGGNISAGTRLLTVTLYGDANGTVKLWQGAMNTPVDANGVFNVMLGTADNPLPPPASMDRAIWLGVSIDNAPELRPLSEVTASVYAINVADSSITTSKIVAGAITSDKLASGSVTSDKLNMDYISSITVNGEQVTSKGANLDIEGGPGIMVSFVRDSNELILTSTTNTGQPAPIENGTVNWGETGNYQIAVPTEFLGTTDTSSAMEIHLEDASKGATTTDIQRVVHLQYEAASPNITMGYGSGSLTGNIIGNASGGSTVSGSTISGGGLSGKINSINGNYSTIGGGDTNVINSNHSFIGGGEYNRIDSMPVYSFIGGGDSNHIGPGPISYSVVGGGQYNTITNIVGTNPWTEGTEWHVLCGGRKNAIITDINATMNPPGDTEQYFMGAEMLGGGESDTLDGPWGFIGGGKNNIIANEVPPLDDDAGDQMTYDVISGGQQNSIDTLSSQSFIGGGFRNHIAGQGLYPGGTGGNFNDSAWANLDVIAGGSQNRIRSANEAAITGGYTNLIDTGANYSFIGGGYKNIIQGPLSVIGGGERNYIYNINADHNVIGGGLNNIEQNPSYGVIAGGAYNLLDTAAWGSGILSGDYDTIYTQLGAIGGGRYNSEDNINDYGAGIASGERNHTNANLAFIGGGQYNQAFSDFSTVGGGQDNIITSSSDHASVPGGDSLIANSYAQTVVGYNNLETSTAVTKAQAVAGVAGSTLDRPLFIVGNGKTASTGNRANAFEVSYDGHSVVHDVLGDISSARVPVVGGEYKDNVIVAWADVAANATINHSFGVATVVEEPFPNTNVYVVTLNIVDPETGAAVILNDASIVATPQGTGGIGDADGCITLNCSEIGNPVAGTNEFIVRTYLSCAANPEPFFFQVVGRH